MVRHKFIVALLCLLLPAGALGQALPSLRIVLNHRWGAEIDRNNVDPNDYAQVAEVTEESGQRTRIACLIPELEAWLLFHIHHNLRKHLDERHRTLSALGMRPEMQRELDQRKFFADQLPLRRESHYRQ